MGSIQNRAKPLESAISVCLLAILFLISVGVFLKQFDVDMSRFGIQHQLGVSPDSISAGLAPYGFEILSEIEVYNSENLYEKINGKAPLYTESGFRQLTTQRFISKDDQNLWFELYVYDMANIRNAFSVFSVQRRVDEIRSRILDTDYTYRTSNALYSVNGQYYIESIGSAESEELFKAMVEISNKLRKKLPVDKVTEIAEMRLFASENVVPGSVKLYLSNAFGFEGLTDTFTAQYKFGDETITAFLSRRPNPKEAQTVAESYYNFLIDNGGVAKPTAEKALETKVIDFYDTTEIVFAIGPFVAGIHEAESQQAAKKLAVMLINKLSKAAKAVSND
jgi:hypothetical protein